MSLAEQRIGTTTTITTTTTSTRSPSAASSTHLMPADRDGPDVDQEDGVDSPETHETPPEASTKPSPSLANANSSKVTSPLDLLPRYMRNALKAPPKPVEEPEDMVVEEQMSPTSNFDDDSEDLDGDDDGDTDMAPPKRKRTNIDYSILDNPASHKKARTTKGDGGPRRRSRNAPVLRGVPIGVWRDSSEPMDGEKHAVYGFVDIHDRLRTRLHQFNRRMEGLIGNAPFGAGKCWVTLERIIFDEHLKELSPAQLKEYVRLRCDVKPADTDAEQNVIDLDLAEQAKERISGVAGPGAVGNASRNPRVRPTPRVSKAEKVRLAEQAREEALSHPHSTPGTPQESASTSVTSQGFQPVNAPQILRSQSSDKDNGIVIGWWAGSDAVNVADKHAAGGLVGNNDSFRIKILRCTRDGRPLEGNYPGQTGGLWLHFEDVMLEPHLEGMNRNEAKEYCKQRLRQMANGPESDDDRKANELKAAQDARALIATNAPSPAEGLRLPNSAEPELRSGPRGRGPGKHPRHASENGVSPDTPSDIRRTSSALSETRDGSHAQAQADMQHDMQKLNRVWSAQHPQSHGEPMVMHAAHAIAPIHTSMGAHGYHPHHPQQHGQQGGPSSLHGTPVNPSPLGVHAHTTPDGRFSAMTITTPPPGAGPSPHPHGPHGPHASHPHPPPHLHAHHPPPPHHPGAPLPLGPGEEYVQPPPPGAPSDPLRFWNGIRYERKVHGPFAGRLVSAPQLINIEGEDLVEYRVLTKPSFF